jgi:hypothetical protein
MRNLGLRYFRPKFHRHFFLRNLSPITIQFLHLCFSFVLLLKQSSALYRSTDCFGQATAHSLAMTAPMYTVTASGRLFTGTRSSLNPSAHGIASASKSFIASRRRTLCRMRGMRGSVTASGRLVTGTRSSLNPSAHQIASAKQSYNASRRRCR